MTGLGVVLFAIWLVCAFVGVGARFWERRAQLRLAALWLVPLLRFVAPFGRKVIFIGGELYMTRYYLTPRRPFWRKRWPDLYLHHIHMADGDRALHNHPYADSYSTILRGGYVEEREVWSYLWNRWEVRSHIYNPGDHNALTPRTFHRIRHIVGDTWTLFRASSRHGQGWGFKTETGFRPVDSQ